MHPTPSVTPSSLQNAAGLTLIFATAGLSAGCFEQALMTLSLGETTAGLALGILAFAAPQIALTLFLLILPLWGGHYAAKPQMVLFLGLFSALTEGLSLRLLLHRFLIPAPQSLRLDHPLSLGGWLFLLTALLSLSSLPLDEVISRLGYLDSHSEPHWTDLKEVWVLYPLMRAGFTLQCGFLFFLVPNMPSVWGPDPRHWLLAILGGVVATLAAGLLDYYAVIDLRSLRPLEDWVNPNNVQQRLQSFFGHSAWCAQYLTVAIPSALVLLTLPMARGIQISLLVGLLVVGEFVLILTFQRGGWVSYPLTLTVIWFSIHVLRPERGASGVLNLLKASIGKIALSVPLTLLVSMTAFTLITGEFPSKYVDRFKAIGSVGERTMYIPVALKLFWQHPLFGGGVDSFAYRYVTDFLIPGGPYAGDPKPLAQFYNNAHSAYLRTLTGQGILGLLALIATLSSAILGALRLIQKDFKTDLGSPPLAYRSQIIAMVTLCAAMAFAIYGLVDDYFYVPALEILFFFFLGLAVREVPWPFSLGPLGQKRLLLGIFGLFLSHLLLEYGFPGTTRQRVFVQAVNGCYPREPLGETGMGQACSGAFEISLVPGKFGTQTVVLLKTLFLPRHPGIPVPIEIEVEGEAPKRLRPRGGVLEWLVLPLENPHTPGPLKVTIKGPLGDVPLRSPKDLSLDRRPQAVYVWPDASAPLSRDGALVLAPPQRLEDGIIARGFDQGGEITFPRGEGPQLIRTLDPTVSGQNPVWVFLKGPKSELSLLPLNDSAWHPLPQNFEGSWLLDSSRQGPLEGSQGPRFQLGSTPGS